MQKISLLTRKTLMFPLALVLFEFSVYIANDMIQPGMLTVTQEFGASAAWIASAMTAFLFGGALLQWLFGPLSDRIGRRPVMLGGTLFFILSCLATLFSKSIESFIVLRVVQGIGLCFISSVGYAVVQEAFEEKAAVKVTAMMANVALIAPLIGPVAGAFMIEMWPWRMIFVFIACVSTVAFIGLALHMPETVIKRQDDEQKIPLMQIWHDYRAVFSNRPFLMGALAMPMLAIPLLGWIALSPMILVVDAHMSVIEYGLWQIPVFGSLIVGNLLLASKTDRWRLGASISYALYPVVLGAIVMLLGVAIFKQPHFIAAGVSLLAFGQGLAFAVLMRFTLTESPVAKGTVAAAIGMLSMLIYGFGIELYKLVYLHFGMMGFAVLSALMTYFYWRLSRVVAKRGMALRVTGHGDA
ncbi:MFS transporter [Glaciimonas soli]|uniref:Multidrug transporter MdfA n=1 Tax=Glaciimonas soli TaxID=2590999 RepID=A0A843YQ94_9BURK|nr:MFS transporter [Glaciimonas soli]MQQ99923.1 MdfA family multidrug efflux MFS transporter [Glaciimonas soli]